MCVDSPSDSMSEQTSDYLAKRLQQNWMNRYPDKPSSQPQGAEHDDSLTNLNWLQDINLNNFATDVPLSPPPHYLPNSPLPSSPNHQQPKVPLHCTGSQHHASLPPTYNSSQFLPRFATLVSLTRFRDECVHTKKAVGNRNLSGLPHPRSNTINHTHRLIGNRFSAIHRLDGSPDQFGRSILPTAHILRSSAIRNPITLSHPTANVYTSELSQPLTQFDGQTNGIKTTLSAAIADPVSQLYSTTVPPTTTINFSTGNLSLSSYPGSELITYPPSELLLVRTKSLMTDRTNYPTIVRTHGSSVYPSLFARNEPPRFGGSMPVATDLVDVSNSGLFVTMDSVDPVKREEYRKEPNLCPPYSFHNLIYMSMHCMKRHKVTLNDICTWIMENFAYFRMTDTNWQDILRENLTTSRCFQRVQRRKEEPRGKGDLWRLNPEFQAQLEQNKVSPKFLSAWQNAVSYSSLVGAHSMCTDHTNDADILTKGVDSTHQSSLRSSPKSLLRYTSLEELISEEQEFSSCFKKRKRMESLVKPTPYSDGSSVNDTASSCASSSSPPLSDLYTPPPPTSTFLSDSVRFSPNQDIQSTDSFINTLLPINGTRSEHGDVVDGVKLGKTTQRLSAHGFLYPVEEHTETCDAQTDQSMAGNHELSEMDAFFRTVMLDPSARLPDEETTIEFTQTCGLQSQVPLFDLPVVTDPLDLTVRGVGLKPLHDWFSGQLPESMTELFTESLEMTTNRTHLSPEKDEFPQDSPVALLDIPSSTVNSTACANSTIAEHRITSQEVLSMAVPTSFPLPRTISPPNSPLSVGIEQQWIDEQLNLEELDNLLGLS